MVSSLYIHIPFCHSKCHYCSFSSYPGLQRLYSRYVQALKSELRQLVEREVPPMPLQTLFFGGGTPTVLPAEELVDVVSLCSSLFSFAPEAEISTEANPGTIDQRKLDVLRQGGFNRLSIGVQSFSTVELKVLGRCHTPEEALQGYAAGRRAGFDNISLDLMYGLCGQTEQSWLQSLQTALDLAPEHLSMYQLTVEDGTPFADLLTEGVLALPDEDLIVTMDELNITECAAAGLAMYEISNFARPGRQCRHNVNYWHNNEYMAVGAGAVSYLDGVRERRVEAPEEYCCRVEAEQSTIIEREILGQEASFRESVIMGLRLTEGIARERLRARYGIDPGEYYGEVLEKLIAQQLVELTPTHLRVTPAGRVFSNTILAELV